MSDLTPRQWHSVAKKMRSHRSYRGEMDQIRKEAKLRRKEREKRTKRGKNEEQIEQMTWKETDTVKLHTADTADTNDRHKMRSQRRRRRLCTGLGQVDPIGKDADSELALMSQSYIVKSQCLVLITCRRWNQADFLCIWPCFCVFLFVPERHQWRNLGLGSVLSLPNTESCQGTVAEFC